MGAEAPGLIGRRVRRLEDPPLVTGRGRYAGDIALEGLAHLALVRSPLAHAVVRGIGLNAVREAPGVVAAWTLDDLPELAGGMGDAVGPPLAARPRPVLASKVVRYQGEALAVVVAETAYQAADATALVELDLDPLPVASSLSAAGDGQENLVGTQVKAFGDVEAAFAGDPATVSATFRLPRICGGYMEPRAATAAQTEGRLVVWASTQWTFGVRDRVAGVLGMEKDDVVVRAHDVGGGFGPKGEVYPEDVIVAAAARRLGRPVRWVAGRTEDTLSTAHAHGTVLDLQLAADTDGRLRGLRGVLTHDAGAYATSGAAQPDIMVPHLVSAYRLPALSVEVRVLHTNAVPGGFVRGGGRPVGNFAMERLIDLMARRLGRDPAEVRRLNLVRPEDMPYDTGMPSGRATVVYDFGDYPGLLDIVRSELGDVREGPREDGRITGVGVVCCVESSAFGRREPARARLLKDGRAQLYVGSTPQGQGHRTAAAQVFAERLGWPLERVEVTAGDTSVVGWALMTAGSRTAVQVGNASAMVARTLRRQLLERAAERLEADPSDVVMEDGRIHVRGTPASAVDAVSVIPDGGLQADESFDPNRPLTYPSGAHGAVVAVDPETGEVDVERYVIAHDTGKVINPLLVEGQMQGGFAHGLGYALFEEAIYSDDGQLTTASFLDYTIASVNEVRAPELHPVATETDSNPESFKGAGESGTLPVPAAIASAVERAIQHVNPGAAVTTLPLSPERVLRLLRPST